MTLQDTLDLRVFPKGLSLEEGNPTHEALLELAKKLDESWEFHIEPWLNGLRPALVLLSKNFGVALISVEKVFEKNSRAAAANELAICSDEIRTVYCPTIGTKPRSFPIKQAIKTADGRWTAIGLQQSHGGPSDIFEWRASREQYDLSELIDDLRLWLAPPDHVTERQEPLKLSDNQAALARSRTSSGLRRIRGPAGSGKSQVLAARAAELTRSGKQVLVICFNITLVNYLVHLCCRNSPSARAQGVWTHFHGYLKRLCFAANMRSKYLDAFSKESFPNVETTASLGTEAFAALQTEGRALTFDAILVDEGQDFAPQWWNLLRTMLNPGGEMVLVADMTQDVYGVSDAWTDTAMTQCGFVGRWTELKECHRIPLGLRQYLEAFGELFLPPNRDIPSLQDRQLSELSSCEAVWIQETPDFLVPSAVGAVREMLRRREAEKALSIFDVTLLVESVVVGRKIVESLKSQYGINCVDTFDSDYEIQQAQKMGFGHGSFEVRATTLHSFKGWESRAIVLVINRARSKRDLALIYTGLTRLKWHPYGSFLTVTCCAQELAAYGATWPSSRQSD